MAIAGSVIQLFCDLIERNLKRSLNFWRELTRRAISVSAIFAHGNVETFQEVKGYVLFPLVSRGLKDVHGLRESFLETRSNAEKILDTTIPVIREINRTTSQTLNLRHHYRRLELRR